MDKFFIAYGAIIVTLFTVAAYRGDAVSSLWARTHHEGANGSHYYHK